MSVTVEIGPNLRFVLLTLGGLGLLVYLLHQWWMTSTILRSGR